MSQSIKKYLSLILTFIMLFSMMPISLAEEILGSSNIVGETTPDTAYWTINQYTVTFDSQNGSSVSPITTNYNTAITKPTDPTRTGYTFAGWYNGSTAFDFATPITTDVTLTAYWMPNAYNITYDANGGIDAPANDTALVDSIYTLPSTVPTKSGYTFIGWDGSGSINNGTWSAGSNIKMGAGDVAFTAYWTINQYTVTFDSQNGSAVSPIATNYNTAITKPTDPTRAGYTFAGWYSGETAFDFATPITANITLIAHWMINQYTVTFDSQNGSSVSPITTDYNTTIAKPIAPTRTGYSFVGWYKDSALTTPWNFATDTVTADITLYAKWNIKNYTVTFKLNNGYSDKTASVTYNTVIGSAIPTNPTRTSYIFNGWFDASTGGNAVTSSTLIIANTTVYAQWRANTGTDPNGFKYSDDGRNITITGYSGSMNNGINIPSEIFGEPVTSIGNYAFSNCSGFTGNLTIPNSVTSIGDSAFSNCSGFTGNLIIPESVTSIGNYAFAYCSGFTGNLPIPNSVTSIGDSVFYKCSGLTGNLIIPESVTSIGNYAFSNCSGFTGNLTIPNSVTSIGNFAFFSCSGFSGALTLSDNLTYIGSNAFKYCTGFFGKLNLPRTLLAVGDCAFQDCNGFTGNLTLPSGLISIGVNTFLGCSGFTGNLIIPNTVTSIGNGAFEACSGLTGSLILSNNLTKIADYTFAVCKFTGTLSIPDKVTSIGDYAFSGCSRLTGNLIIPDSVKSIGNYAFSNCSGFTGNLTIPNSVTSIRSYAFSSCSGLKGNLTIPESVEFIGNNAFDYCRVSNIYLTNTNTMFGSNVFYRDTANIYLSNNNYVAFSSQEAVDNIVGGATRLTFRIPLDFNTIQKGYLLNKSNVTVICGITVSYVPQNGSQVTSVSVSEDSPFSAPIEPIRTGYTFNGWYTSASGGNLITFPYTVTDDITLYAQWIINTYTVTFNSSGGTTVINKSTDYNTAISAPTAPTRTHYTFDGWYNGAIAFDFATPITANITLTAHWTINQYTVTFDSRNGSAVSPIATNYNTGITKPTNPTRTGYTFSGWYNGTTAFNFTTPITANVTLTAHWTINQYTVTFDSQNGSAVSSIATNYNTAITKPTNPTRTGYTFDGWYKEASCINLWDFGTAVVADNTLFAKWNANSYVVEFCSYNGNIVKNIFAVYNTKINSPVTPTRIGYTFGGWYKEASCINLWDFGTDVVTNNIMLYARWLLNVQTVSLSYNQLTIAVNQSVTTVKATVIPANASNKELIWTSSNTSVASVDTTGKITGVKTGTATITVTAKDGSGKIASCTVTVVSAGKGVTKVTISKSTAAVDEGYTIALTASLTPSSPTNKTLKWISSNNSIATVTSKGIVKGLKPGVVTITVNSSSGISATCKLTVNSLAVNKVTLSKTSATLEKGKSLTLVASLTPSNAINKTIIWTSSNTSVATVTSKGFVNCIKPGSAVITATAHNGLKMTCSITVTEVFPSKVVMSKTSASLYIGSSLALKVTITPSTADNKTLSWTSSNSSIATVDANGNVKAISIGTATITAKSVNGKTTTCKLTVNPIKVSKITVSAPVSKLEVGSVLQVKASITPTNATNKTVTWKTSSSKIATVDSNGKVTGIMAGTATITATASDGSKKYGTFKVTVVK